tara:strand:- start:1324 stop:2196 length:873 start_codon:yes stop_codon:yes gene_type:complete
MAEPDKDIINLMTASDRANPLPRNLNELMRRAVNNDPEALDTIRRTFQTDNPLAYAQSYTDRMEESGNTFTDLAQSAKRVGSRLVDSGINVGKRMLGITLPSDLQREAARSLGRAVDTTLPFETRADLQRQAARSLGRAVDTTLPFETRATGQLALSDPGQLASSDPEGKVLAAGDEAGEFEAMYIPEQKPLFTPEYSLEMDRKHMSFLRQTDPEAFQRIIDKRFTPSMLESERPSAPLRNPMTETPIPMATDLDFEGMNEQDAMYLQWLRSNDPESYQNIIDKRFPKRR